MPDPRPRRLVTVERTGGAVSDRLDHPTLAIQSWAPTLEEASELSREVDAAMRDMPYWLADVSGVDETTIQRWPDPDSKAPRYQGLYTLTTGI